jgi:glycosyltransferase involved in cell wall biosynthesis
MKSVLFLIITDYGSYNNFLSELAIELDSTDYVVHVISSQENIIKVNDKFDYKLSNIIFHNIPIPRSTNLKNCFLASISIYKLVKQYRPVIVHAHFTTAIFPTVLFKSRKTKYYGTFHGLGMNSTRGVKRILFTLIELFCFIRLNKILLVNNKDYILLQNKFPKKSFKYSSYGFGCDINKFDSKRFSSQSLKELKEELKIGSSFVITFTGRYVKFKGFKIVHQIFCSLLDKQPNFIKLILVGGLDPIHETGLTDKEFNDFISHPSVINIGFSQDVSKYLALTDLFLFPSEKEGLPTCIVEALSMGVPVLTLNERGNSDIIIDSFNGYLINKTNDSTMIDDFANRIITLFDNKTLYSIISKNCLLDRDKYSRKNFVFEQIFFFNDSKDFKFGKNL